jgi:RNA polymerase sigma-70 factor, ECF subfamily
VKTQLVQPTERWALARYPATPSEPETNLENLISRYGLAWVFDSSELIQRVAQGDQSALAKLYELHRAPSFGLCIQLMGNPRLAEEVLQEVFVQIWEEAATHTATFGSFSAWLMGLTRRLCLERLRHPPARPARAQPFSAEAVSSCSERLINSQTNIADSLHRPEQAALIHETLGQLSQQQRLIIQLAYFQGITHQTIARHFHCTEAAVRRHARLALQHLQQQLAEPGDKLAHGYFSKNGA